MRKFIDTLKVESTNIELVKKFLREKFGTDEISVDEFKNTINNLKSSEKLETLLELSNAVDGTVEDSVTKEVDKRISRLKKILPEVIDEEIRVYFSEFDIDHYEESIADEITERILNHVDFVFSNSYIKLVDVINKYNKYEYLVMEIRDIVSKKLHEYFDTKFTDEEIFFQDESIEDDEMFFQSNSNASTINNSYSNHFDYDFDDPKEFLKSLDPNELNIIFENIKQNLERNTVKFIGINILHTNMRSKNVAQINEEELKNNLRSQILSFEFPIVRKASNSNNQQYVEYYIPLKSLMKIDSRYESLVNRVISEISKYIMKVVNRYHK